MSFILHLIWGSAIGRCMTAILAGFLMIKGYGLHQKYLGKQEVKIEAQVEGEKKHVEAEAARKRVDTDDKYFSKRLKRYCRDC